MLSEAERTQALDAAAGAALEAIDAATDDKDEADVLWVLLGGGVFASAFADTDDAGRESMIDRLNAALERQGCAWRLTMEGV